MMVRDLLPVQIKTRDANGPALGEIREMISSDLDAEIAGAIHECHPLGREVVSQDQEQREIGLACLLQQVVQVRFDGVRIDGLARRVADVEDHIRNGRIVECGLIVRQQKFPGAFR